MVRPDATDDRHRDDIRYFVDRLRSLARSQAPDRPFADLELPSATDSSSVVACVVDHSGNFVGLTLQSTWWHSLGPTGLGPAVLDALHYAQLKSLLATAILGGRNQNPSPPQRIDSFNGGHWDSDPTAEWAAAEARIRSGWAMMDAADRFARERDSPTPRTITGSRRLFSVHLLGFTITGAGVDPHLVSAENSELVGIDAEEALTRATRDQQLETQLHGSRGRL